MDHSRPKAFTLVQLILAVFVMAVFIRITLGGFDRPMPRYDHARSAPSHYRTPWLSKRKKQKEIVQEVLAAAPATEAEVADAVAVLPYDHGELDAERGPLLARVLRQYRPMISDLHGDELLDTLPPNVMPRVIVIVPSVEKPETPCDEKSGPDYDCGHEPGSEEAEDRGDA